MIKRLAPVFIYFFGWLSICLSSWFSPVLMALDPGKELNQYSTRVWNTKSGLPDNSIFALRQTRDGYLWIGTQDGLVRFDGVQFEVYTREKTPGLEDNIIRALYEDPRGNLWIGTTAGGLTRYRQGKFSAYSSRQHPCLDDIRAINSDRRGNLWVGSASRGLTCINWKNNGGGQPEMTTYTEKNGLPGRQVYVISTDENQDPWVCTGNGVVKITRPGVFQVYAGHETLPYFKTTCLYEADKGSLWIGTGEKGLFQWKDGIFTAFGKDAGIPHPTITHLFRDTGKNLWIGTEGGDLTRISSGLSNTLPGDVGLASGPIHSMCEDREGSLWIGTLDGGLHQLIDSKFTAYTTREGLVHDYIECIYEDRDGYLWLGAKGGLNILDPGGGKVTASFTTRDGLGHDTVLAIHQDAGGAVWVGTWAGLHRFKPGNRAAFDTFTTRQGLSDNRVTCIAADSQGNTWIGTENGLNRFEPASGTFTRFTTREGLSGNFIAYIFTDSQENLCISTGAGLDALKNGTFTPVDLGVRLKNNPVRCSYRDSSGVTWLGTGSGLIRWRDNHAVIYTVGSGLQEHHVCSIHEDKAGYLWLAGENGISRVRKTGFHDFSSGKIPSIRAEVFNEMDGMKSSWCTGMACKTRDGELWFPTSIGAAVIAPGRIQASPPPPPLSIEKIAADGETIPVTGDILKFPPGKKRLEFYYTAISFRNPRKIKFKSWLEGYDPGWVDMGTRRSTSYTGLPPGRYTFRVTACNTDGAWNREGASFTFYLQPYFYQTPWFYAALILSVFLGAFFIHRFRVRQLRKRQKELSALVERRTRDLARRTGELETAHLRLEEQSEKLKELDKVKSRFFANISHEFRTPLTLIMGPLEQTLAENPGKKMVNRVKMMLRSSSRLLDLVNQLLELAKFDSGKMKLQAARQNIVPFARSIVMCFESLARQNNVELVFQADEEEISPYFDARKIERIIANLLANAFKYTPARGKIQVSLRKLMGTVQSSGRLEISVRDTGPGIPAGQLPHIFDRFYSDETGDSYKRTGTGIGLALVKELVELHRGEINVHSRCQPDQTSGTEFILRLPMGNDHLQEEEIVEEAHELHELSRINYSPPLPGASLEESPGESPGEEPGKQDKPIILVVDDNADVRAYIRTELERQFNIEEAADGREGIDKAREIMPGLVISDIMMPGIDGYELCARLKKDIQTSHIPVILLTAKASESSIIQGLETGADDYITKPFNAAVLLSRVKNLVRLRRQLQRKIQDEMMLRPGEISVSSLDREFMEQVQAIIEENLSEPGFKVGHFADKLYMSKSSLYRKLEALTGQSPQRFIQSYRLKRAAQFLAAREGNVTEVAFKVGFSTTAYFTKCFKEKFHRLPSDYQTSESG
jgi:signal transduction histidine kinase/ligand-binding sensor domain-containing protein/DNA-binding response OmpR family regulator